MIATDTFYNTFHTIINTIRFAGFMGLFFFGSIFVFLYVCDALLYIFRLSRFYFEYLQYSLYGDWENSRWLLHSSESQDDLNIKEENANINNQLIAGKEMTMNNATTTGMEKGKMNPNLQLLRYRLKKYYTKFFNH